MAWAFLVEAPDLEVRSQLATRKHPSLLVDVKPFSTSKDFLENFVPDVANDRLGGAGLNGADAVSGSWVILILSICQFQEWLNRASFTYCTLSAFSRRKVRRTASDHDEAKDGGNDRVLMANVDRRL